MNITTQQKQVLDTIETMTTSFHSSNISGIMSTYASDATVVFEPGKLVSGKSDIQSAFEQMFPLSPKFSFGKHDVFITGNIATHIVPWDMTATLPDGSTMNES